MPISVAVREMRLGDAGAVAELAGQLNYPTTLADMQRRFELIAKRGDARAFVAEATDGQVVGWIHIYGTYLLESDCHAEIGGLVVREGARGLGVGRTLLAAAELWARQQGHETVLVRSNVMRVDARVFYEHLGYVHIKTQNNFRKILA